MEEIYKTIDLIIEYQKKARRENNFVRLVINAEALLELIPRLIDHSVTQEGLYRKFEATMSNERDDTGKRYTSSYSETQAKATDMYTEWRKADKFIELMYEMVNLSKKLVSTVEKDERNG